MRLNFFSKADDSNRLRALLLMPLWGCRLCQNASGATAPHETSFAPPPLERAEEQSTLITLQHNSEGFGWDIYFTKALQALFALLLLGQHFFLA